MPSKACYHFLKAVLYPLGSLDMTISIKFFFLFYMSGLVNINNPSYLINYFRFKYYTAHKRYKIKNNPSDYEVKNAKYQHSVKQGPPVSMPCKVIFYS